MRLRRGSCVHFPANKPRLYTVLPLPLLITEASFQIARMASLQSRIDLPARKPGRSKRLEKMSEKEEVPRRSSRSRGPVEEVQELPRTPRGKRRTTVIKALSPQVSPGKRKGAKEPSGGSPNKQSKTPAKGVEAKENDAPPLTPASQLAGLSINSPLQQRTTVPQPQALSRKGPLFSPEKDIANLLDSPNKSPIR